MSESTDAGRAQRSSLQRGQRLQQRLAGVDSTAQQSDAATLSIAERDASTRSRLSFIVIATYAAFVGVFVLVMAIGAVNGQAYDKFYDHMLEFSKIALLPVVTYALGFYSAQAARRGNGG